MPWLEIARLPPYSAVVTHNGTIPLAAIAVRFARKAEGRIIAGHQFYNALGAPGHPLLVPGRSYTFSPLRDVDPFAERRAESQGSGRASPISGQVRLSLMEELASADEIHISIDLAVAPDGRSAGPDKASTIEEMRQRVAAYQAVRRECLARLERGNSDQEIGQWLESVAAQDEFHDVRTSGRMWLAALQQGAELCSRQA